MILIFIIFKYLKYYQKISESLISVIRLNAKRKIYNTIKLDGSGKSTLSELLVEELSKNYGNGVIPFHKWLSDKLKFVFGKKVDYGRSNMNIPYKPNKSTLSAIIKATCGFVDNILFLC